MKEDSLTVANFWTNIKGVDALARLATAAALASAAAMAAFASVTDYDLWGHVRFGQDIIAAGAIPTADPYSYVTSGFSWINHEWLAEVFMAAAYNAAGPLGLVLLKGFMVLSTIALIFYAQRKSGFDLLGSSTVTLLSVFFLGPGIGVVRPHLFTYLFFAATCIILKLASTQNLKWLWLLPFIMVPWTNCHGGFLAGAAVVLLWICTQTTVLLITDKRDRTMAMLALVLLSTALAMMVNPYGPHLLSFLLSTATVARPEIGEWQPLSIASLRGLAYLLAAGAVFASILASRQRRYPSLIAVSTVMALAPLAAARHLPLFGIAVAILCSEHIRSLWEKVSARAGLKPLDSFSRPGKLALITAATAAAIFISCRMLPDFGKIAVRDELPVAAVELLADVKARANMANYFDWGEYIIWKLGPSVKVSVDGRRETAYPIRAYLENLAFMDGVGPWQSILDRYPTDLVLVSKSFPCYSLMCLKSDWIKVFEDDVSAMFVRDKSPLVNSIRCRLNSGATLNRERRYFP